MVAHFDLLQTLQTWTSQLPSQLPSLPPSLTNHLPLLSLPTKFPLDLNLNLPTNLPKFNLPTKLTFTKSTLITLPTKFTLISLPTTKFALPRLSLGKLSTLVDQDQDQLLNRIWIGLLVLEALLVLGVLLRGVLGVRFRFRSRPRSRWSGRELKGDGRYEDGDGRLMSPWNSPMGSPIGSPVVSPVGSPVRGGGYYRSGYGQKDGYFGYEGYEYGYRDGYQRRRSLGVGSGRGGMEDGYGWEK
ncbi:uncharacterized protein C8A04DRAFT_26560 [Dichotomopilus funicola]|uniref:Uncharacterized protein n=1 Tax=Dichotomopilus funicola TaxID=1934379 RepID=A0AAN6V694_9PEZI|nr:hypothetical protein C8A04DRAFT_26560 [Dichotomopilus funicola]